MNSVWLWMATILALILWIRGWMANAARPGKRPHTILIITHDCADRVEGELRSLYLAAAHGDRYYVWDLDSSDGTRDILDRLSLRWPFQLIPSREALSDAPDLIIRLGAVEEGLGSEQPREFIDLN